MPKPHNAKSCVPLQGTEPQRSPEQRERRNRIRKDQPRRGPDQPLAPHAAVGVIEHKPRKIPKVYPRSEVIAAIRATGGRIDRQALSRMLWPEGVR